MGEVEEEVFVEFKKVSQPISMTLTHMPARTSSLELAVVLEPIDAPEGLGKREGMIGIGTFDGDISSPLIKFSDNWSDIVDKANGFEKSLDANNENFGFYLTKVKLSPGEQTGETYANHSIRQMKVKIESCLKNSLDHTAPEMDAGVFVALEAASEEQSEDVKYRRAIVDENGCFESFGYMTYDDYGRRGWYPHVVKVKTEDQSPFHNIERERGVRINPWLDDDNFGKDDLYEPQGDQPLLADEEAPRIFIDEVEYTYYNNDDNSFILNPFLNLRMNKRFEFVLSPKLKVGSDFSREQVSQPLQYGTFDLEVAIFIPYRSNADFSNINLNDFYFLTYAKKRVTVEEGKIVAFLESP